MTNMINFIPEPSKNKSNNSNVVSFANGKNITTNPSVFTSAPGNQSFLHPAQTNTFVNQVNHHNPQNFGGVTNYGVINNFGGVNLVQPQPNVYHNGHKDYQDAHHSMQVLHSNQAGGFVHNSANTGSMCQSTCVNPTNVSSRVLGAATREDSLLNNGIFLNSLTYRNYLNLL